MTKKNNIKMNAFSNHLSPGVQFRDSGGVQRDQLFPVKLSQLFRSVAEAYISIELFFSAFRLHLSMVIKERFEVEVITLEQAREIYGWRRPERDYFNDPHCLLYLSAPNLGEPCVLRLPCETYTYI